MKNRFVSFDYFYNYINNIDSLYNLSSDEFEEYNDKIVEFLTDSVFSRISPYDKATDLALRLSNIGDPYSAYLFLNAESKTRKDRYTRIFYEIKATVNLLLTGIYQKSETRLLSLLNEIGTSPMDVGLQCYIMIIMAQLNAIFKEDYTTAERLLNKVFGLYTNAPDHIPQGFDSISKKELYVLYFNTIFDIYNRALLRSVGEKRKYYVKKIESLIKQEKENDEYFSSLYKLNYIEYLIATKKYDISLKRLKEFDSGIENTIYERLLKPSIYRDYARIYAALGNTEIMYKYAKMSIVSCKIYGNALDERIMINDIIDITFKNSKTNNRNAIKSRENGFMEQLMQLLRLKDWYTSADHSANVRNITTNITYYLLNHKMMQAEEEAISQLRAGAYLHDIGKLYIPWFELNKIASLTNEEFTLIKNHTVFGKKILDRLGLSSISKYASGHHERINKTGYPYRIKPDILTNIVAVSDCFDAATSESRKYKVPKSYDQACIELKNNAGKGFYAEVVNTLCNIVKSGENPKIPTSKG